MCGTVLPCRPEMDLIVNGPAAALSSLGVRRYFAGVIRHLAWSGKVEILPSNLSRSVERARELFRRGRRDAIFWTPCQRGPLWAMHHVVTVHDCINVEYVHREDWRLGVYLKLFNQILDNAEAVVAISQSTKAAILRNYDVSTDKIVVIPSGVGSLGTEGETTPASRAGRASSKTQVPFVLLIANTLPHKNTTAACLAYAQSRCAKAGVMLRVVGSLPSSALEVSTKAGFLLEVRSDVGDAELSRWYTECLFLFSPSLAEGHNLPIGEALAHGANVLCSDIDVHREFYDHQVAFFDPRSQESMVAALDSAIDREGRWFARPAATRSRSLRDVSADYKVLFTSIETGERKAS
jgi:glycosyltransferase involved in cell wall biosynthesis